MTIDSPTPPALRASDADRDRVIELLHAAVADGRLDPAEFDERLDAALTARTIGALARPVTDLVPVASVGVPAPPLAGAPVGPAAERVTIKERHGSVRRDGRWTLPHRLALRTAWSDVLLDLTGAVRSAPELVIDMRVRGGTVDVLLAPGMALDANGLSVRHSTLAIGSAPDGTAPVTLHIHLVGSIRHGRIEAQWPAAPAGGAIGG